jgi:hypothetical protein
MPGLRARLTDSARSWLVRASRSHTGSAFTRDCSASAACLVAYQTCPEADACRRAQQQTGGSALGVSRNGQCGESSSTSCARELKQLNASLVQQQQQQHIVTTVIRAFHKTPMLTPYMYSSSSSSSPLSCLAPAPAAPHARTAAALQQGQPLSLTAGCCSAAACKHRVRSLEEACQQAVAALQITNGARKAGRQECKSEGMSVWWRARVCRSSMLCPCTLPSSHLDA